MTMMTAKLSEKVTFSFWASDQKVAKQPKMTLLGATICFDDIVPDGPSVMVINDNDAKDNDDKDEVMW